MNWKYNVLRRLRKIGLLAYLNIILPVRLNGRRFRIPFFHGIGLDHFRPDEKWMINTIDKLTAMKKGQFIDVGLNIGQTLLNLKSVNPHIKYVGFEPTQKVYTI